MNNEESIGQDLLKEVDQLSRDKYIEKNAIFMALEDAIRSASKSIYGYNNDIRVKIDRNNGDIKLTRHRKVVDEINDPYKEILKTDPEVIGDCEEVIDKIPLQTGRSFFYNIKNNLIKKIYELERTRQYNEYIHRVGEVIVGIVKRVDFRHMFVDIGRAEAVIYANEMIPREKYRVGDTIKAYIYEVTKKPKGAQIFLSRTHPGFLKRLFEQEISEVSDGTITVKLVARDPGSRAKVAVYSNDSSVDPIGACVGVKGARINAVSKEVNGEKIDVILWSADIATFVINALTPSEVTKVVIDNTNHRATVVVPDNQHSVAIGRRGQNVMLAHQLTGCHIDIVSESDDITKRAKVRNECVAYFMEKLDIEEMMAYLLVSEGFETVDDIINTPIEELSNLQGFNPDIANELYSRSIEAFHEDYTERKNYLLSNDFSEIMFKLDLPMDVLMFLYDNNIKNINQFADMDMYEINDIATKKSFYIDQNIWGNAIIKARKMLYND